MLIHIYPSFMTSTVSISFLLLPHPPTGPMSPLPNSWSLIIIAVHTTHAHINMCLHTHANQSPYTQIHITKKKINRTPIFPDLTWENSTLVLWAPGPPWLQLKFPTSGRTQRDFTERLRHTGGMSCWVCVSLNQIQKPPTVPHCFCCFQS